jgi:hypothetical protein
VSLLRALFSTEIFMPRGHEYLWTPKLLVLEGASNFVLAVSCLVLAVALARRRRKGRELPARRWTPLVVFLALAAWTHLLDVWVIWAPLYWLDALVRCAAALAAVVAAGSLVTTRDPG